MTPTYLALLGAGGAVAGLCSLLRHWLTLRFLRHVYDRGGARDLGAAARAVASRDRSRRGRHRPDPVAER